MDIPMADNTSSSAIPVVDGVKQDSASGSPSSSTGAPVRPRQKQVPIPRNSGSGCDRAERARTSHACEPCRERKTKCDGERPSCRRCLHTGTGCHYGYGKGWKKRKTAEDLTVTSRKLARYEVLLDDIFPLVSPDVRAMIDEARQQEYLPMTANEIAEASTPSSSNVFDPDLRIESSSTSRISLPIPGTLSLTQSAPQFSTAPRSLPPPPVMDSARYSLPRTPSAGAQRPSRSPTEGPDNGLRLPSITRHGYLMNDGARVQLPPGLPNTAAEAQSLIEQQNGVSMDGELTRGGPANNPQPG